MNARGDVVSVVLPREYGKPRPAVVVRSDLFAALPSVSVCPLTSDIRESDRELRPIIDPTTSNGLRRTSQILTDKVTTLPRHKIGGFIGRIDDAAMREISRALALYLAVV